MCRGAWTFLGFMEHLMKTTSFGTFTVRRGASSLIVTILALAAACTIVACDENEDFVCLSDEECSGVCVDGTCVSGQDAVDDTDSDGTADSDDGDTSVTPVCGDSTCNGTETVASCYEDCGTCGDSICTDGEEDDVSCYGDCGECGDSICTDGEETVDSCAQDCAVCGDDLCTAGEETIASCAEDCAVCGDALCTSSQEDATSCPEDCANCGDDVCDTNETIASCYDDCGRCGDEICTEGDEDDVSCYADCGRCGDLICQDAEADGLPDACPADCDVTAFRSDSLSIPSPAFYLDLLDNGDCQDQSGLLNGVIGQLPVKDGALTDADGFYDLSLVQLFTPYSAAADGTTAAEFGVAECTFVDTEDDDTTNDGPSLCTPSVDGEDNPVLPVKITYGVSDSGTCGAPLPGAPPEEVTVPSAPCYATAQTTVTVNLLGIDLTLKSAIVTAGLDNLSAPTALENGTIAGFLTLADARKILFPEDTALVGGKSFASLLDGPDSCQGTVTDDDIPSVPVEDLAVGPGGNPGWWFYIKFTAESVEWSVE